MLRAAGVTALAGLAGCADSIESHFQGGVQGVIPIEITHEGEQSQNVQLEAFDRENDRQTYDQGYTITVDERVGPPHLEATEQRFRVTRFEDEETGSVATETITPDTQLVRIRVYDDDVDIDLSFDEEDTENVTEDADIEPADEEPSSTADD